MPTIAETQFLSNSMDSLSRALMNRRLIEERRKDREQRANLTKELLDVRRAQYAGRETTKPTELETAMMKSRVDQLSEIEKKITEIMTAGEVDENTGSSLRALQRAKQRILEELQGPATPAPPPAANRVEPGTAGPGDQQEQQAKWLAEGMKNGWVPKETVEQEISKLNPDERSIFESTSIGKAMLEYLGRKVGEQMSGDVTKVVSPASGAPSAPAVSPPPPTSGMATSQWAAPNLPPPEATLPPGLNTNIFTQPTGGPRVPLESVTGAKPARSLAERLADEANRVQAEHPDWSRDKIISEVKKRYSL